ncbi:amino acid adenylation domain-containing protein [Paenibacillus sp. 481]|nr:amino acid adenylation domain-containing protein [Paenibacillus sp. 481]
MIPFQTEYELFTYVMPEETAHMLDEFVRTYHVSREIAIGGAWGALLGRYNDVDQVDVYVREQYGTTILQQVSQADEVTAMLQATHEYMFRANSTYGEIDEIGDNDIVSYCWYEDENGTPLRQELMLGDIHISYRPFYESAVHSYLITFYYKRNRYQQATKKSLADHFFQLIKNMMLHPDKKFGELELLTDLEKQQLIFEINHTQAPYPMNDSVVALFENQVALTPDHIAIAEEGCELTYAELNKRANRIAHVLRKKGVAREQAVGILAERSVNMVIGILAILKSGGAYVPIDSEYPQDRIQYLLEDSGVQHVLTSDHLTDLLPKQIACITFDHTEWLAESEHNPRLVNSAEDLIYIMYTSGSTGRPKGVMVTHRNVVRLVKNTNYVSFREGDTILQTGSLVFDASTFEIWGALLNGIRLVIVDKETILDSQLLEQAIVRYQVTTLFLTTALFIQLVDSNVHLFDRVEQLLVGGELMSPKHILHTLKECAPIAVSNIYGPTENTTFSTSFQLTGAETGAIPIGVPISNSTVYVVNAFGQLQPVGVVGELWVGGDGVARGYLNREDLTKEQFIESPFKAGEKIYKTGDLVRMLPDGNIEFVGRKDHQVKIRGYRMELAEIETQIHAHEHVNETIVIDFEEESGQKALCAYIVADASVTAAHMRAYLVEHLPAYMVPAYMMFMERMPLTINGKIDRAKLPQPEKQVHIAVNYEAPANEIEQKLVEMWEQLLGFAPIGVTDNFFERGGHSLKLLQLQTKIEQSFHVGLSFKQLFAAPSIRSIAILINQQEEQHYEAIGQAAQQPHYVLAPSQRRIFALEQRSEVGVAYNIPLMYRIQGNVQVERLEQALANLIERHEALRTSFHWINEQVVQRIHTYEETGFKLQQLDGTHYNLRELTDEFSRPFNLAQAPLFRATLAQMEQGEYVLLLDVHHIVFDGTSLHIFADELSALYEGRTLEPVQLHLKDYAEWHQRTEESVEARARTAAQEQFWGNMLAGELPLLELPTDFTRPPVQSFAGDQVRVELSAVQTEGLKRLAKEQGVTLYMVLLSLYKVLLSKYADKEDLIVCCAIAARTHADLDNIIGMFVNTLPIRSYPAGSKPFATYVQEMKETMLSVYEHQAYPLDSLLERLPLKGNVGRSPLFDTVFVMQNMGNTSIRTADATLTLLPYHNGTAKFDLLLEAVEHETTMALHFEYCKALFLRETVERLAHHFMQLVAHAVKEPERLIGELEMVTEQEKLQLIEQFNCTSTDYPQHMLVHRIFEERALATPHRVAIKAPERELTYGELNAEANQLAHYLRTQGVTRDQAVGLFTERTADMIVGVLAIMKAGGAYLPIDPSYPQERIQYLIEDSGASIVLTNVQLIEKLPEHVTRIIFHSTMMPDQPIHNLISQHEHPDNLIYLMYTSGSTGKPKGVMVTHRNVVRLVQNTNFVTFHEDDCMLQTGSLVFDASTFEIWGALLNGLTLVIVAQQTILDAEQLGKAIKHHRITMMWLTSPLFTQLVEKDASIFAPIRTLLVGGDVLSPKHIYRVLDQCAPISIVNGYGPTENTTFSTCYEITQECEGSIPIGVPIANSTAYVVDRYGKLLPIGLAGELWVGGDGVARGYLNQPDLTDQKFIDNPFKAGQKLYKTGDLVRWLPDGNIQFLGRKDHQVKIRGYRMELGEIEAQIRTHERVKEILVVDIEEASGQKALSAYIVAEGEMTAADIRQFLLQRLPDYMIPTYYAFLEQMPLTTNGKMDRTKLPAPVRQEWPTDNYIAPANDLEQKLVNVWQELLRISTVGVEDNFFELGGHSLKAIALVAQLKREFEVDVSDVFAYPTIRQLTQHMKFRPNHMKEKLERIVSSQQDGMSAEAEFFVNHQRDAYTANNVHFAALDLSARVNNGNVLLTGATGYLGAYLLHDLLTYTDNEVTVIIRGDTSEHARLRLMDKLDFYFGAQWFTNYASRIQVLAGNLSEHRLGLHDHDYDYLAQAIDAIIHAAANVKHYGHYSEFVLNNVTATEHLLQLAAAKRHKSFHHVSTMSLGMGTIEGQTAALFTEDDLDMGQRYDNYYVQTKFEAERLVVAARAEGLNTNIYRVGNIVFHSMSGKFQENIGENAFYNRLRSFIQLGSVPDEGQYTDLSFVDQVSRAIVTLFDRPAMYNETFHIYNPNAVNISDMLVQHHEFQLESLSLKLFMNRLFAQYDQDELREAVENVMLHSGWMNENEVQTQFVHAAERTTNVLKKLDFQWIIPNGQHFSTMIAHCVEVGFIKIK